MLGKPFIDRPIVGTTKPNHLADAVAAFNVQLSPEEVSELKAGYIQHPVLGFK